jgi:hypothetical protein
LERGQRRSPYPHTVRALVDALDLSGNEPAALLAAAPKRTGMAFTKLSGRETLASVLSVLPTPLIGRERDTAAVRALLERRVTRLLTHTGLGGVGKTRLALRTAWDAAKSFPDGVAFVSLTPLSHAALVVPAISRSLGLRERGGQTPLEALLTHLRERRYCSCSTTSNTCSRRHPRWPGYSRRVRTSQCSPRAARLCASGARRSTPCRP